MPSVFELVNPFTPAISIDAPLSAALHLFQKCALSMIPVVREGIFCGVIERESAKSAPSVGLKVRDLLSLDAIFLSPRDSAQDAVELLSVGVIDVIPVVTPAGCLAGIITPDDLPPSMRESSPQSGMSFL